MRVPTRPAAASAILLSTLPTLPGRNAVESKGVVTATVVHKTSLGTAGSAVFVQGGLLGGGRVSGYEAAVDKAKAAVLAELQKASAARGAGGRPRRDA